MQFVVPEMVVSHFHLREGDRACDFGAGSGHFTMAMARRVGGDGRVFAVEIQKQLAEGIAEDARKKGLHNIEVVWGDLESDRGVRLPDNALDAAILSNTLFQMERKAQALTEIKRTLRPGGKFFLIDWSESFSGMGPHPQAVVTEKAARELAEAAGFAFERTFPAGAHHYGLAFRKA
jgi:ubiquinone/menaquinone biosynthesis C-methylase UbiE